MSREQKVTSRELSEKLRDAGAKQDSELVYVKDNQDGWLLRRRWLAAFPQTHPSAFDWPELIEQIPNRQGCCLSIERGPNGMTVKWSRVLDASGTPLAPCISYTVHRMTPEGDALGHVLLWCLENGHCEKDKPE